MNRLVTTVYEMVNNEFKPCQDRVYLESGEHDTKNGEKETGIGEAHLTQGGHGSTDDKRQERKVCHGAVGSAVVSAVDKDGEDRAEHAHGLVEGNGDHSKRQVGNGDVGSEESTESNEGEVLATPQS
jgi:hypothetical protein